MIYLRASVLGFSLGKFTSSSWFCFLMNLSQWLISVCMFGHLSGVIEFFTIYLLSQPCFFYLQNFLLQPIFSLFEGGGAGAGYLNTSSICPFEESTFYLAYVICCESVLCFISFHTTHFSILSLSVHTILLSWCLSRERTSPGLLRL